MSKVSRDCIGFALICSIIGPELDHSLSPSDVKVTPITTWKFAFSRASGNLVVFTFNSHQLIKYFPFLDSKSALIQNNWKAINRCERLGPKH